MTFKTCEPLNSPTSVVNGFLGEARVATRDEPIGCGSLDTIVGWSGMVLWLSRLMGVLEPEGLLELPVS